MALELLLYATNYMQEVKIIDRENHKNIQDTIYDKNIVKIFVFLNNSQIIKALSCSSKSLELKRF